MVASSKRRAKREIRWAYRSIDRALAHVRTQHVVFEPTHPDHAVLLESAALTLVMAQAQLEDFYRLTWGAPPRDWYQDP